MKRTIFTIIALASMYNLFAQEQVLSGKYKLTWSKYENTSLIIADAMMGGEINTCKWIKDRYLITVYDSYGKTLSSGGYESEHHPNFVVKEVLALRINEFLDREGLRMFDTVKCRIEGSTYIDYSQKYLRFHCFEVSSITIFTTSGDVYKVLR